MASLKARRKREQRRKRKAERSRKNIRLTDEEVLLARNPPARLRWYFYQPCPFPMTREQHYAQPQYQNQPAPLPLPERLQSLYDDDHWRPGDEPLPVIWTASHTYGWKRAELVLIGQEIYFRSNYNGHTYGLVAEAECGKDQNHPVPATLCTCGWYSLKQPDVLLHRIHPMNVLLCVAHWGTYIEGHAGVRAQHQQVMGVWIPETPDHLVVLHGGSKLPIDSVRRSLGIPVNWLPDATKLSRKRKKALEGEP